MDIRKIDEDYSVSPQIEAEDVDIVSLLSSAIGPTWSRPTSRHSP